MANFCNQCGGPLKSGVAFCNQCGAPARQAASAQATPTWQGQPPQWQTPQSAFAPQAAPAQQAASAQMTGVVRAAWASGSAGYMQLEGADLPAGMGAITDAFPTIAGPLKTLTDGLARLGKGFGQALKNPKALLVALALAGLWLLLDVIQAAGVQVPAFFNWLTFAQGGLSGGVGGFVGGLLGKGMIASVAAGLLAVGKKAKASTAVRPNPVQPKQKTPGGPGLVLLGLGVGLFFYNLMTGNNAFQNSMAGIIGVAGALRSAKNNGFVNKLSGSVGAKLTGGSAQTVAAQGKAVCIGLATGLALGVPGSAIGELLKWADAGGAVPWVGYLLGGLLALVGLVVCLAGRGAKGVGVA